MSLGTPEKLILASGSAVRARLLEAAGVAFAIEAASLDEDEIKTAFRHDGRSAADCAAALAEAKAARVSMRHAGVLVIGADQILECEGRWLDKPVGIAGVRDHLDFLRGKRHELVSAVAVLRDGKVLWHRTERAFLTMRNFSDRFRDDYVAAVGEEVCSSVGAYALEGLGVQLFARIEGDYTTILGLPLLPLLDFLRGRGAIAS